MSRNLLSTAAAAALVALLAGPSFASFGGGGKKDDPPASSSSSSMSTDSSSPKASARQEAEKWYGDAYDDVQKAGKELEKGKTSNAEKKFRRALERGQRATEIDTTYYEAWNLVGYSARKLKDYDRALASYQRCLAIKSDYAPAHEYLGEAYLELNRLADARAELATLTKLEAHQDEQTLSAAIDAYVKAHPDAAGNGATAGSSGNN